MAALTLSVLLLVGGVVAMLVLHILIVVWALRRGAVLRAAAERDEERAEGLSAGELARLPCHEVKAEAAGAGAGGDECAVCLEAFQGGDRCRVLPGCEHGFHPQCVDPWLRRSRVCPVCRAEVVVPIGSGKAAGEAAASSGVVAARVGGVRVQEAR